MTIIRKEDTDLVGGMLEKNVIAGFFGSTLEEVAARNVAKLSQRVQAGNRIRIEGDTFSINPPKDGDA